MKEMVDLLSRMESFPGFIAMRYDKYDGLKEIHISLKEFLERFGIYETKHHDSQYDMLSVRVHDIKIFALREKNGSSSCENPSL